MISPVLPVTRNDVAREMYAAQQKMPLLKPVEKTERIVNNADKKNEKGKYVDFRV